MSIMSIIPQAKGKISLPEIAFMKMFQLSFIPTSEQIEATEPFYIEKFSFEITRMRGNKKSKWRYFINVVKHQ